MRRAAASLLTSQIWEQIGFKGLTMKTDSRASKGFATRKGSGKVTSRIQKNQLQVQKEPTRVLGQIWVRRHRQWRACSRPFVWLRDSRRSASWSAKTCLSLHLHGDHSYIFAILCLLGALSRVLQRGGPFRWKRRGPSLRFTDLWPGIQFTGSAQRFCVSRLC